ncbi:histone deacetylase HDAC5 [Cardiosporidium cionae]|uniref:Histone deacetylase HDAC5 n=1 Tax=Cardiosporidium cionae TaxID=476202 RepID=A0ABQ7JEA6_9APIC|nr:histone deacetylase HDAC5 [Cardiosporidium cionae]|eukprot:KAF8822347.1 histone deacetylase HDAC5 [Cardiosporidium cionae]
MLSHILAKLVVYAGQRPRPRSSRITAYHGFICQPLSTRLLHLTAYGLPSGESEEDGGLHRMVLKRNIRGIRQWLSSPHRDVLNDLDHLGRTPLHIALIHADVPVLSMLLHPSPSSTLPLTVDFGIFYDNIPCFHLIFIKSQFSSSRGDALECLRSLSCTPRNFQIDAVDTGLRTALHRSCGLGDAEITSLLLQAGADAYLQDENGDFPIHSAIDSRDPTTFMLMLNSMHQKGVLKSLLHRSPPSTLEIQTVQNAWKLLKEIYFSKDPQSLLAHVFSNYWTTPVTENEHALTLLLGRLAESEFFSQELFWEKVAAMDTLSYSESLDSFHGCFLLIFYRSLFKKCVMRGSWRCFWSLCSHTMASKFLILLDEMRVVQSQAEFYGFDKECSTLLLKFQNQIFRESSPVSHFQKYDGPSENVVKTRLVTHPCCSLHLPLPEPTELPLRRFRLTDRFPENPMRLEVLVSPEYGIFRSDAFNWLEWEDNPKNVRLSDILRVHDWGYLKKLRNRVAEVDQAWCEGGREPALADGDTPVTPHSWDAALSAAGSVIAATDAVCSGACRNAFCAVRPPGHHLGSWGAAQSEHLADEDAAVGSQGFCLLNNVAIGAGYAKYMYANKGVKRIAIVDFDVHHGNGTEQIIRNVGPKFRVLKESLSASADPLSTRGLDLFHLREKDALEPQMHWSVGVPCWMGWSDENDPMELFFASIHAFDGQFYPGTGRSCKSMVGPTIINVALPPNTSSKTFRSLFISKIIHNLLNFKPDLIYISAGFDGHYLDTVSNGFTAYTEADFEWATRQLVAAANTMCAGRIISVLEGGYNTKALSLSPFARSVGAHVKALHFTSPRCCFPVDSLLEKGKEPSSMSSESYHGLRPHLQDEESDFGFVGYGVTSSVHGDSPEQFYPENEIMEMSGSSSCDESDDMLDTSADELDDNDCSLPRNFLKLCSSKSAMAKQYTSPEETYQGPLSREVSVVAATQSGLSLPTSHFNDSQNRAQLLRGLYNDALAARFLLEYYLSED